MKKIVTFLAALLVTVSVFLPQQAGAQSPEKMSYQAVIRNSNDGLVNNQSIGMQISILQGSADGTVVYTETQTPTTDANGLVSVEIGDGTIVSGDFAGIDWANGSYFIKTETDPEGGINYTISGTSQLLSVPYALFAKTAGTVTGTITESDPVFTNSNAANISETDITNLENLSGVNTGDQDLSDLVTKTDLTEATTQIRSELPGVSGFISSESDPVFTNSNAANISASDMTNLGNLSGVNTGDQDLSSLATKSALAGSTAQVRSEMPDVSGLISSESDPVYSAWDKSSGISITESQVTDLTHFTTNDETDPVFGTSAAGGITAENITKWNNKLEAEVDGDVTNEIQDLASVLAEGNDAGAKQIKNIATPTDSSDAVPKDYIDQFLTKLMEKYDLTVANFSYKEGANVKDYPTPFIDASTISPTAWLWDFGDDSTSTEQNPAHTYSSAGPYYVSLTATTNGFNSTKTKIVPVLNLQNDYYDTITDSRDGNTYKTIKIGNQEWMAENLRYCPKVYPLNYSNLFPASGFLCYWVYGYNFHEESSDWEQNLVINAEIASKGSIYETYGVLYNWLAAMDSTTSASSSNPSGVQGACPEGWHLPSLAEWTELVDSIGGDESLAGGALKAHKYNADSYWEEPNTGASNAITFTALPGGKVIDHNYEGLKLYAYFWTSSGSFVSLSYNSAAINMVQENRGGRSIRCVKDE